MAAVSLAAGVAEMREEAAGAAMAAGALPVNLPKTVCHLPRVGVSLRREIRTVLGLRSFRPSGFASQRDGERDGGGA